MGETGKEKSKGLVVVIAAVAAVGGLLFGFDTGVISGALLFIKKEWALLPISQEFVVSAVLVGAILGAALSGKLADRFGRRRIIIATAVIFAVGSFATALAHSVDMLILGRIVIGIAIGVASFTVPLYISEISPAKMRGALVSLNQLAITIGIVASYVIDDFFAGTVHGWRYMFAMGVVPAVILGVGMLFLSETPRWLVRQNKLDEARHVVRALSGNENVEEDIDSIKDSLALESGTSWSELAQPWLRLPLFIGVGLMFIQQVTGINTVIYYAPTIFQMAGFSSEVVAITATVGVGVVNVLMTIVSIWLIDRIGRKPLMYIGLTGIVITLGLLGLGFKEQAVLGGALKWATVASVILYIASFAVSLGPICWLIISEIYPLKIRGLAMSIATMSNWLFNFFVALTFLTLVQKLTAAGAFWLYAIVGVIGLIFCYYFVPETKGHSLEKIEEHFKLMKSPRDL
ncbi:MAG: sugar porter family MFS transporter [Candidatus Omnitrophota bacterium]